MGSLNLCLGPRRSPMRGGCQCLLNNTELCQVRKMPADCRNVDGPYHRVTETENGRKFSAGKSQNDTEERNSNCIFMMLSSELTAATQE